MTVRVSFNPDVVARLAACGITAQQRSPVGAPQPGSRPTKSGSGFVLARGSGPCAQGSSAHVISVHGHVVVTGHQSPAAPQSLVTAASISVKATDPRAILELVQECDRLHRDNQRLSGEVARLRAEIARLTARSEESRTCENTDLDDAATRFALLELDL